MTQFADVFPTQTLNLAGTTEQVVIGGRDKFHLLPQAFQGIKQIGVIGWGSQGPAQAQNLRESLEGTGIKVVVGLRPDSPSFEKAWAAGFTTDNGTLGDMWSVIPQSDLVLLLTSDAAQTQLFRAIQESMKSGSTLGLSHGFLIGHMRNVGATFREELSVVGVCPKGMGPSVRRLFEQGREVNGAGINASYAVEQDFTGNARNIALGWAVGIGSPYVFPTTLEMEYRSDIFGERGVLLGGVWGMLEELFDHHLQNSPNSFQPMQNAFMRSALSLTGPISRIISEEGLLGVQARAQEGSYFWETFRLTFQAVRPLLEEIYDEVQSGREIASVVAATERLNTYDFTKVDGSPMWSVGDHVRRHHQQMEIVDPKTAGAYLGLVMAQVEVLLARGHGWSEIVNETVLEAVDSLNPYMHARGVAYMVDNCSTTARLGTRKWGPNFAQIMKSNVFPNLNDPAHTLASLDHFSQWFQRHQIHGVLETCMKLRPPVSIALT